jgi:heptosyltransferase-2
MSEKTIIGPIKDLKTLIEALPLARKFSNQRPKIVLTNAVALWKELLKGEPNIEEVAVSDTEECTLDLRKVDPFEVVSSQDNIYIYPWLYLTEKERADAQERSLKIKGPRVIILKDGLLHGIFLDIKKWLRESPGIEPEVLSFEGRRPVRETLSEIAAADIVVSASVEEALLVPATGGPTVVLTEDPEGDRTFFRAFFPPQGLKIRDEFGPVVRLCPSDREEFIQCLGELIPKNRAIFFDRDGTLCEDVNYLRRVEDLRIFPEVDTLRQFKDRGFLLIGVTNQSGIARGIIPPEVNKRVNEIFINDYDFDDFYFCPHHPEEHCACRKPSPGMLLKARRDHGVDLRGSIVVGDKDADMLLARVVGARAVLVTTGQQKDSPYADEIIQSLSELHRIVSQ